MKRFILFLLGMGLTVSLSAELQLPEHTFAVGNWSIQGDRVFQNDENARLAKVNIRAAQSGSMLYEFNVRYEGGSEDGQGGFGIHIFADSVTNNPSWGNGRSYLLWLNYDRNPAPNSRIPAGLSGQVYRSYSNSRMELIHSIDLNHFYDLLTKENLAYPVPIKIWVDGNSGEVRIYDPTDPNWGRYYYFNIDRASLPLRGNWVVLRTNGIRLSFAPESQQ